MTERLDRIEAILERTARQQERSTNDIDTLLGAVGTTEVAVRSLQKTTKETEQLFNTIRAEANQDRAETRQLWSDAVTQMETGRAKTDERFSKMIDRMDNSDERFNETLTRIDAQQEVIQRLLVELIQTNRDTSKLRDRVDNLEQAS